MVAYKAAETPRVARNPKPNCSAYLVFGNDGAQISEICRELAHNLAARSTPPGGIIRLSDQDISQSPGRLSVELQTLPMFGGAPVVWLRSTSPPALTELDEVLTAGNPAAALIVEAGNLAKGSKLRQRFEQDARLAALPCYGDDASSIDTFIEREASALGVKIAADARPMLKGLLGTNLALARSEFDKLLLYAGTAKTLTGEMVENAVGDMSQGAVDALITATLSGDRAKVPSMLAQLEADGVALQSILSVLLMHLLRLIRVKAAIANGANFAAAARQLAPPLHFRQEAAFQAQLRLWGMEALTELLAKTQEAARLSRLSPQLEYPLIERHLLGAHDLTGMKRV